MTTTFRAHSPADLLAAIPTMAGYTPRDSVVILPFAGTTSVGLFRFDLPPAHPQEFAASALGIVCRLEEATGMLVVIYSDAPVVAPAASPFADLVEALRCTADACGIELGDVMTVATNGWFCDGEQHIRPLSDIGDAPDVGAPKPRPHQGSGTRLPRVDAERVPEVRSELARLETVARDEHPRDMAARLSHMAEVFESAVEAQRGSVADDALLLWLLARPSFRDVALAQWCYDSEVAEGVLDFQLDWLDGCTDPPETVFLMGEGPAPSPDRLRAALRRVRHLAACTSGRDRAAPLGCAAWISWALGMSTHAASYANKALRAHPGHGLAQIVATLCANGHLPLWAFPAENRRAH